MTNLKVNSSNRKSGLRSDRDSVSRIDKNVSKASNQRHSRNRVSFSDHQPDAILFHPLSDSENEEDIIEYDEAFTSVVAQSNAVEEDPIPLRTSSIQHHYTPHHLVRFETDNLPVYGKDFNSSNMVGSSNAIVERTMGTADSIGAQGTETPVGSLTRAMESAIRQISSELHLDMSLDSSNNSGDSTANDDAQSIQDQASGDVSNDGIVMRRIQPAPWEENLSESSSVRSTFTLTPVPVGLISDSEPVSSPSPFYTTDALAKIAREKHQLQQIDPHLFQRSSVIYNKPYGESDTAVYEQMAGDTFKRTPFRDSAGKSIHFLAEGKRVEPTEKITRRKICCITIFVFLGVLIAGTGVLVALWRVGVISPEDWFKNVPSIIAVKPKDPSEELIIDPKTPPGPFGCSNVPIRAAKKSSKLSAKGFVNDGDKCPDGSFRYTLTECDILSLMYPTLNSSMTQQNYQDSFVKLYVPHLNDALELYDVNCAKNRLIAFLAQVKHETNGLTTMRQPIDGGAGSIHLLPIHFSRAIQAIPAAKSIYEKSEKAKYADRYSLDDLARFGSAYQNNQLGTTEKAFLEEVANTLIARPEITFLTAGWWFEQGGQQILGHLGCKDLRLDADLGKGSQTNANSTDPNNAQSGFYQISRCIFGSATDAGIQQRVGYFDEMMERNKFACQTKECPKE